MSDLDFIISKFEEKCQLLFSKEVNQESFSAVDNSESSRELDAEKFWSFEQAIFNHITISTYCLRGYKEMFLKPKTLTNWQII